jgi:uncharacterized protein YceH (UPF0502 family)
MTRQKEKVKRQKGSGLFSSFLPFSFCLAEGGMMSSGMPTEPGASDSWPVLDMQERRVLGVLVEKAKTTADAYPLSVNALVTGCNQKSNRDPIMEMDDGDVEEALLRCKAKELVMKVIGGRVERWRHLLYEAWHVDKVELAILAELLLRGPQTEGELRTRASRMEPIEDLDALRGALRPLVERNLVLYLTPEERRGAVLTHGFHDNRELEILRSHFATASASVPPVSAPVPSAAVAQTSSVAVSRMEEALRAVESLVGGLRDELAAMKAQLGEVKQQAAVLEKQVAELRAGLAATQEELRGLRQALGG